MKRFRMAALAPVMIGLAGCGLTDLNVPNENNPDRAAVLERARDIENVIGGSLLIWWQGTQFSSPSWALSTAADEGTMSWGNFGMQQLSSEPRVAWPNEPSFTYSAMTENGWYGSYGALSSVYDGLRGIAADPEMAAEIDVNRARAFAKLVQGLAHGWLALMYDSAFVFDETVELFESDGVTPKKLSLQPYPDIYNVAVSELQEAIASASGGFTTPTDEAWFDGIPMTHDVLARFAHSLLARLMTQVPRTPAERAAIDWPTIISHVDAGIVSDIEVVSNTDRFWKSLQWYGFQTTNTTWARADYKHIGWTDTSGSFASWLATPVAQRNEVLLQTADARLTAAGNPQADGTDFKYMGPSRFPSARGTYHFSFYGGKRFANYPASDGTAPARWMTTVEMQLLKAEALLRTAGPSQAVADIINATRVTRGKLPPALATESQSDLMDKLIYEKRIEGYLLCSGCAYFDRRGLGPLAPTGPSFHHGLVEGTPLHFAPPGKELEILQRPLYSYGGVGTEGNSLFPSSSSLATQRVSTGGVPAWRIRAAAREWISRPELSSGAADLSSIRY